MAPIIFVLDSTDLDCNTPSHKYCSPHFTDEQTSWAVDWLDQGHQLMSPNSQRDPGDPSWAVSSLMEVVKQEMYCWFDKILGRSVQCQQGLKQIWNLGRQKWKDPSGQIISADSFLPVVERELASHLLAPWVSDTALCHLWDGDKNSADFRELLWGELLLRKCPIKASSCCRCGSIQVDQLAWVVLGQ